MIVLCNVGLTDYELSAIRGAGLFGFDLAALAVLSGIIQNKKYI